MQESRGTITIEHPLGVIEVPRDAVMHFTTPMLGFRHSEYALLPAARKGLWWLIGTGEMPTTFVLADPFVAIADYAVDLNDSEREELALRDEQDALALVLLVMPATPGDHVTGNFRAPLVFNLAERKVKQVVNRDERHGLSERVDLSLYELTSPADGESADAASAEATGA